MRVLNSLVLLLFLVVAVVVAVGISAITYLVHIVYVQL